MYSQIMGYCFLKDTILLFTIVFKFLKVEFPITEIPFGQAPYYFRVDISNDFNQVTFDHYHYSLAILLGFLFTK